MINLSCIISVCMHAAAACQKVFIFLNSDTHAMSELPLKQKSINVCAFFVNNNSKKFTNTSSTANGQLVISEYTWVIDM